MTGRVLVACRPTNAAMRCNTDWRSATSHSQNVDKVSVCESPPFHPRDAHHHGGAMPATGLNTPPASPPETTEYGAELPRVTQAYG